MKLDTAIGVDFDGRLPGLIASAGAAESTGYDCLWTNETKHDPFWPLIVAAEHTRKIKLGTAIAVAFARSPAAVAHMAWDIQSASGGRHILGLGTQVKGHIERRFGMTWDQPAARLRDYILAVRALWNCWQSGGPLNHRGEFYKLTLMTPFFNPGPIAHPNIPIYIAGVNDHLCRLAGELCEGFHVHPFHTPKYLADFVLPNITAGVEKAGRKRADVALVSSVFAIVGDTPDEQQRAQHAVREQISFYASTPTYRVVMETHGWGGVADQLAALAAQGKWAEMPALITDDILDEVAVRGTWANILPAVHKRCAGLLDRVMLYLSHSPLTREQVTLFNA